MLGVHDAIGRHVFAMSTESVAAIATTLDPSTVEYENTMIRSTTMREPALSREMRMTLREFFSAARRVHQLNDDTELLEKMSPMLQGTVALAAANKWLDHIWFFRDIEQVENGSDFIAALAKCLIMPLLWRGAAAGRGPSLSGPAGADSSSSGADHWQRQGVRGRRRPLDGRAATSIASPASFGGRGSRSRRRAPQGRGCQRPDRRGVRRRRGSSASARAAKKVVMQRALLCAACTS